MLLTIDAGNTQTVVGLFRDAELVDHWRIATVAERTSDELALMVQQFLGFHGFSFENAITGVAISSGVPRVTAELRQMTERYFGFPALVLEPGVRTGMPILYDNPKEVGADRIAANGDVANKVGTYLKALACADNGIPFYVAAPRSTLDFACPDGAAIPIEERDGDEFRLVHGLDGRGVPSALQQLPARQAVANPAFDVTPARLVTAIITERGICPASGTGLLALYPEISVPK